MRPAILALLLLLASCQAKKSHKSRSFRHSDRLQSAHTSSHTAGEDIINQLTKHDEHEEWCHRAALHKCGGTFLRAHKLLSYLVEADLVAFRTRCGLRTAFFECLKMTRDRICGSRHHPALRTEPDFRKRLTDALWSTRICVLGVQSFSKH